MQVLETERPPHLNPGLIITHREILAVNHEKNRFSSFPSPVAEQGLSVFEEDHTGLDTRFVQSRRAL